MNLTSKQQEIVDYIDGPVLVTAGPGSGKTRVLTQRIANILEIKKGKVLALTFSNKAAEEISDRVKSQLEVEDHDRVNVETIHSFCLDLVLNKGNQIGMANGLSVIEDLNDRLEILKKAYMNSKRILPEDKTLREVLQRIQDSKKCFLYPESIVNDEFKDIFETYNNLLLLNRMIDFDDILYYSYRILVESPTVAKNYTRLYKYILIDEAQDLNDIQYRIIKALTVNFNNIMMVGDSAQSIYGFNGSDSNIMTERFVEDYEPKKFSLTENFRSTSKIIEAASKIQPESRSESVFPLAGELQIKEFMNEEEEAEWISNKIDDLLNDGSKWVEDKIALSDVAIIGRNRYIFSKLEEEFKEKNIEFSFGGSSSNVECETIEMRIFELGLRVFVNPYDDLHYRQLNAYLQRTGKPDNYLIDLLENREVNSNEVDDMVFNSIVESWNILLNDEEDFIKSLKPIKQVIHESDYSEEFKFLIQGDIDLWENRWKKYIKQSARGNRSLAYFRNQVSLGKMNIDSGSGVSLLTVHMSKGLEFEIVFIIGLVDGTFPDYRVKTRSQKKEELNNMFVAITRAKRECYLTYPVVKEMPWGAMKAQRRSEYLEILEN
ncbi:ATP-dependent helicase [Brochothrix thermosphacta]|uniref:ATP-dependent helicase n=1 Tax=Brochothrix thermosphacta TaxID=2756 RepID=UPI000EE18129|nr:ATP-dependent helicase [Brochothrix thermosphacta]HCZ39888.1 ATP-dependent helicase [Brochothrix thermosphacta]HCZ46386.1 ATP-dependent helicase [Brochothrix thermosphacta]